MSFQLGIGPLGAALRLERDVRALRQRHTAPVPAPGPLPWAAPADRAVILAGYASTVDVDHQRMKLAPYAFGHTLPKVPILYRHNPAEVAGTIATLEYDPKGQLKVRARVTHSLAKCCPAFSIGARIVDYEMKDQDSRDFYAQVNRAELLEVSCTNQPANPFALVTDRYPVPPQVEIYDHIGAMVQVLEKFCHLLQGQIHVSRA